jgi:hypothetical protein
MHAVKPLIAEPNSFEVETATEKLKRYKTSGNDQKAAELWKQEVIYCVLRSTNLLILF